MNIARIDVEWGRIFPKPADEVKVNVEVKGDRIVYVDVTEPALRRLDGIANIKTIERYREMFKDLKEGA